MAARKKAPAKKKPAKKRAKKAAPKGRPKPKPRKQRGAPIPWQEIEDRWVEGTNEVTHRSLAEEYNLRSQQIGHRASEYHWTVKRLAYRSQVRREVSERVFKEKVNVATDVRLRGIEHRLKHMASLSQLLDVQRGSKLMKLRTELDGAACEEIFEVETDWTSSDHVNHRKAYDEAEAGILKALGVEDLDLGDEPRVPRYIPTAFLEMMLAQRKREDDEGDS